MNDTGKFMRSRTRAQAQEGFTLIELLVVILIIGILAAAAIATFLTQTGKAKDSNLESTLSAVQTTEAIYASDNNGTYSASQTALQTIEPSLTTPFSTYNLTLSTNPSGLPSGDKGFSATGTSDSTAGGTFTLLYDGSTGQVTKSCSQPSKSGCNASGSW